MTSGGGVSPCHQILPGVAPEKYCWGGASAVKVPTVKGVKEFLWKTPFLLAKRSKKVMDIMTVPTLHSNLNANRGSVKFWGLQPPRPPLAPSMDPMLIHTMLIK